MTRPYVKARKWTWIDADGSETPGIALMQGRTVRAHMTAAEARTFADKIHDLTDAAGNPEPVLETLTPESE